MARVVVHGAGDDLVELDGDIEAEFMPTGDGGATLAFSDGTILYVTYTHGKWEIHRSCVGSSLFAKIRVAGRAGGGEDGYPHYTDVVTLDGDLRWALAGERVTVIYAETKKEEGE